MKHKLLVLIMFLVISFSGCTQATTYVSPESHAQAYYAIIKSFYDSNEHMTDDITYLAFDFSGLDFADKNLLIGLAKTFSKDNDRTFIEGTMEELIQQEYINAASSLEAGIFVASSFPDGILLTITPVSADTNEVIAEISMWHGNLSAIGATYTAIYGDDEWTVIVPDHFWIS